MTRRPGYQKGAVTMFSAVLILILLTEMIIYAVQVGVFEQRKSGNEMRQKQAFHAAETGIQAAQEYLLAHVYDLSSQEDATGWLSDTGSGRWAQCEDNYDASDKTHPCWGEPLGAEDPYNLRDPSYFYSLDGGATPAQIPIDLGAILPDPTETVEVYALLCLLDVDRTPNSVPVRGCLPKNDPNVNDIYFVITLLARGHAECVDNDNCAAEVLIAQKLGSYGPLTGVGGPGVPLTSRSTFPPGGTAEVVPNPNGGGPGVPISTWLNGNEGVDPYTGMECEGYNPADPKGGSWSTCERHEWYGVDEMPGKDSPNGKYTCPEQGGNCSCDSSERRLSTDTHAGIDILIDPTFPCDLFEYTFQTPRERWREVKDSAQPVTDCDTLGPDSVGTYWVDGEVVGTCDLSGKTIGSPGKAVFIISGAELTKMTGNTILYGVLMITDVQGGGGMFSSGVNTVYGAVLVEGPISQFSGTFQIVYNDDLVEKATQTGDLGKLYGGWTDFHQEWR